LLQQDINTILTYLSLDSLPPRLKMRLNLRYLLHLAAVFHLANSVPIYSADLTAFTLHSRDYTPAPPHPADSDIFAPELIPILFSGSGDKFLLRKLLDDLHSSWAAQLRIQDWWRARLSPPSPHQGSVFDRASVDAGSYDLGGREHRDSIQDHRLKAQWERDCQWLLTISGSESEYHQQSGGADTRV
jgi:hypothetical protein